MLQNIISKIGKKNPYVLKAIPIPTGIQDPIGFNTDHLGFCRAFIHSGTGKLII